MGCLPRCFIRLAIASLLLIAAFHKSPLRSARGPTASGSAFSMYSPTERFGIGFVPEVWDGDASVPQSLGSYDLAALKVGCYLDWCFHAAPPQPRDVNLECVQLISVHPDAWPPDWSAIRRAAKLNPGSTWIIGNEPESALQDNCTPTGYARAYHEAYHRVRRYDRTAQIAIGAVVQPTPLRRRWLEEAMRAHRALYGKKMPVDVWNIHVHIIDEKEGGGAGIPRGILPQPGEARHYAPQDCANARIFVSLVQEFRTWMAHQGERNKPLIISEFGVLLPSDMVAGVGEGAERIESGDQLVEEFMVRTFDWLLQARSERIGCPRDENRLVQRWAWYSLDYSFYDDDTGKGFNGSLCDYRDRSPTRFGRTFAAYRGRATD